jgi:hypothetical protein
MLFVFVCSGEPGTVCYAYGCLSRKDIVKGLVLPANSDILRVETVTTRRETTWTQSVPFSVLESLTSNEIKRQETIFVFIRIGFHTDTLMKICDNHCSIFAKKLKKRQAECVFDAFL